MRFLEHPVMKFLSPMLAALLVAAALYFFGLPGDIKDVRFSVTQVDAKTNQVDAKASAAHTRIDKWEANYREDVKEIKESIRDLVKMHMSEK